MAKKLQELTKKEFNILKDGGVLKSIYSDAPENFEDINGKKPEVVENPDFFRNVIKSYHKNMNEVNIFGRNYMFLTAAQADELEHQRMLSFMGSIDANTCETNCYKTVFSDILNEKIKGLSGVVRQNSSMRNSFDIGAMWVANHDKKTLTYDGIRSMRVAEELKNLSFENPPLLSGDEYKALVENYSKYYGQYFYRHKNKISKYEKEYAEQTIKLYEEQLLEE